MTPIAPSPLPEPTSAGSAPADIVARLEQCDRDWPATEALTAEAADTITELRVILLEEVAKRGHLMAETHELRARVAELTRKE